MSMTVGDLLDALAPYHRTQPLELREVYDEPDDYVVTDVTAKTQQQMVGLPPASSRPVTLWIAIREPGEPDA